MARPVSNEFDHIEHLRKQLKKDERTISMRDLGAGEKQKGFKQISRIARTSLSRPKFSRLYQRIIHYFNVKIAVELGTSFGINTLYLGHKNDVSVTTFEGSPAVASIAELTFEFASKKNVQLLSGSIDVTLPAFLHRTRKIDFAFMDANHRYEPTIRYFEWLIKKFHDRSILVIDDIHYSPEMEKAWHVIKNHRLVYGSADLFFCGIVFFDPSLNKQHVILQF